MREVVEKGQETVKDKDRKLEDEEVWMTNEDPILLIQKMEDNRL